MPVAAATTLLSAGIAATAGGSPTPPGAASLGDDCLHRRRA
jgi:hypothetical protein